MAEVNEQSKYPEILEDLRTFLVAELQEMGIKGDCERISLAVTERILKYWGGEQLYIPRGRLLNQKARQEAICREFNGKNTKALCRKYGMTERHVYRITTALRKKLKEGSDIRTGEHQ